MSEGLFYLLTIRLSLRFGSALCPVAEEALGRQASEHRRDGSATIQILRHRAQALLFLFFLFFFAGCPVMRPEKEKLHKREYLRAVFPRSSRAPDSKDSDGGRK